MGNVIRNRSLMWRINMDKIIINGGNRLTGEVQVEGAKNAVLPILTASLLASEGKSKLTNVPDLIYMRALKRD